MTPQYISPMDRPPALLHLTAMGYDVPSYG